MLGKRSATEPTRIPSSPALLFVFDSGLKLATYQRMTCLSFFCLKSGVLGLQAYLHTQFIQSHGADVCRVSMCVPNLGTLILF